MGGGSGTTLHMLLQAFPWLRGINVDLPYVVSVAIEFHMVENVGAGNMFESVPKADAAFLMVSTVANQNEMKDLYVGN
jgi:hypothetical protein